MRQDYRICIIIVVCLILDLLYCAIGRISAKSECSTIIHIYDNVDLNGLIQNFIYIHRYIVDLCDRLVSGIATQTIFNYARVNLNIEI